MKKWIIGLMCGLLSLHAAAQTYNEAPIDGIWWNPLESGRGWNIETQNNVTSVLHFAFANDGRATFYTTAGIWNGQTRTLTASLSGVSAGQCVGCPYVAPAITDLGSMRFEFTSRTNGTAVYPNGTRIPIQKFQFVYSEPRAYLKGHWASTWVSSLGSGFSNIINFDVDCTTCTTPNTVEGRLIYSRSGRPALGSPVNDIFFVIVDASTSFYDYYYIIPDSNRWTGLACTGLKTSAAPTLSQCTGLLFASRAKTQAAAAGSSQPAADKSLMDESDRHRAMLEPVDAKAVMSLMQAMSDDPGVMESLRADLITLQRE